MSIRDSIATGNGGAGINSTDTGSGSAQVMLKNVTSANNSRGIRVDGATAAVRLGDSVITGNSAESTSTINGGSVGSYGNNQIDGNGIDTTPAPIALR